MLLKSAGHPSVAGANSHGLSAPVPDLRAMCLGRPKTPLYAHCLHESHRSQQQTVSQRVNCVPAKSPYPGLRDCDVLELESFLQLFRERNAGSPRQGPGDVYLIGTGPGDPGLLTLRAAQIMQSADVVLYDRLVSEEVLALVNPGARMVYVGKTAGYHTRTQDEIHELLLAFSEAGAVVVRLKGGDPYVFGRGGEEVQYLAARGIRVHCVPGITAAAGICAELGIPMTHRGVATSVRFLTGHSREGGEDQLDQTIAVASDPNTTLIVYMGLGTLPSLVSQLSSAGMDLSVPAVAVERGTTPARRVIYGSIGELAKRTKEAGLRSPTLLVIGEVVALSPGWQSWQAAGRPLEWNQATEFPEFSVSQQDLGGWFGKVAAVSSKHTKDAVPA